MRLVVYFDGKCSACADQAEAFKASDRRRKRLTFVDCAAKNFEDLAAREAGLTQADLRQTLHVRTRDGQWFRGAKAITAIYQALDMSRAASFWRSPAANVAYQTLVISRPVLSRLGAGRLIKRLMRVQARRMISAG